ncbi:MAG: response regulator [Nitriliruptorales bacterium]|nr:response regulator [Nitriliruptorales bacterium]
MTRILIVEDDDEVSQLLRTVCEAEGWEASVAPDGLEGLIRLGTGEIDLVLLDLMMPDVSGLRVLQQLFEEGGGSLEVPVIVVTGSAIGAEEARSALDAADVFEKPFEVTELIARMKVLLDGEGEQ